MANGEKLKGDGNEVPKWQIVAVAALAGLALFGCSSSSETPDAPTVAGQTAEQIGDNTGATEEALAEQPKRLLTEPGEKAPYTKKELIDQIRDARVDGYPLADDEAWINALGELDPAIAAGILAEVGVSKRDVGVYYFLMRVYCDSVERTAHDDRFNEGEPILCVADVIRELDKRGVIALLPSKSDAIRPDGMVSLEQDSYNLDGPGSDAPVPTLISKRITFFRDKATTTARSTETINRYNSLEDSFIEGQHEAIKWWNSH